MKIEANNKIYFKKYKKKSKIKVAFKIMNDVGYNAKLEILFTFLSTVEVIFTEGCPTIT